MHTDGVVVFLRLSDIHTYLKQTPIMNYVLHILSIIYVENCIEYNRGSTDVHKYGQTCRSPSRSALEEGGGVCIRKCLGAATDAVLGVLTDVCLVLTSPFGVFL